MGWLYGAIHTYIGYIHAATHMNQKSRRVRERTRGKEQSCLKGVFAEATITGRNNQDSRFGG